MTPWGPHGASFRGTCSAPGSGRASLRVEVQGRLVLSSTPNILYVADEAAEDARYRATRLERRQGALRYEDALGRLARGLKHARLTEPGSFVGWGYRVGQEGGWFYRTQEHRWVSVSARGAFRRAGIPWPEGW